MLTWLFRGLDDTEPIQLWAPNLVYLEVASALRKLARSGAISARSGEQAVRQLVRLPIQTTGSAAILLDAWKLRDTVTPYDAAYLLLARELGAPLITGDTRLARAAGSAFEVWLLHDIGQGQRD